MAEWWQQPIVIDLDDNDDETSSAPPNWQHSLAQINTTIDLSAPSSPAEATKKVKQNHQKRRIVRTVQSKGRRQDWKPKESHQPPGEVHDNMRDGLVSVLMQRLRFQAKFVRFGKKGGRWKKGTVLLHDVTALDQPLNKDLPAYTDHVWLTVGKQLQSLSVRHGDIVAFNARVKWYRKRGGYDLKLSHHTKLEKCAGTLQAAR